MHPGISPDNAPEGPAHGAPCLGRALHFLRKYTGPESGSQYSDFTKSSRTFLLFSQRLLQSESDKIHRARAAEHKIQRTHTVLWVKPCRGSRALSTGTGPAAIFPVGNQHHAPSPAPQPQRDAPLLAVECKEPVLLPLRMLAMYWSGRSSRSVPVCVKQGCVTSPIRGKRMS